VQLGRSRFSKKFYASTTHLSPAPSVLENFPWVVVAGWTSGNIFPFFLFLSRLYIRCNWW